MLAGTTCNITQPPNYGDALGVIKVFSQKIRSQTHKFKSEHGANL